MAILTRRSLGIAAGMLMAVALTAGALISLSADTSRGSEPDMPATESPGADAESPVRD